MVWETRSSTTDKTELKESWLGENPNQETWSMQWKSASRRKKTAAQPCNDTVMSQFTVCQCAARGCSLSAMISNHLLCGRLPRVLHIFAYFCSGGTRYGSKIYFAYFCIFLHMFAFCLAQQKNVVPCTPAGNNAVPCPPALGPQEGSPVTEP